ncbi:MAG: protoheme IX farnesyltransferase [Phycisphaerae bacterium]|jgi:protoheme IX farnesyltransferase
MYPPTDAQLSTRSVERPSKTHGGFEYLRAVLELTKLRITAAVTLTTATGYFLASGAFEVRMWLPLLGVFLLACGSAALNQWQERGLDARMKRTCRRPIPSGRIEPSWALFVSVVLMLAGLFCLTSVTGHAQTLLVLGLFALVWYNGVYTYLKRITAFAVVPGALIGAVPPCMGYVSAGGNLGDPEILLVALFFFVWQIPHFWLLLLMLGDEYEEAGLPTVTDKFSQAQLVRITFVWILATAVGGVAFPALDHVEGGFAWSVGLVAASIWLALQATRILCVGVGDDTDPPVRRAFRQVNAFALMVMVCLSMGALGV